MAEKAPIKMSMLLNMSNKCLIEMLWKSGHLDKTTTCGHCGVGALGPLICRPGRTTWVRRCQVSFTLSVFCDGRAC